MSAERSREMLVGFGPVDEERAVEAFEEVEEEYGAEELNILEGLAERWAEWHEVASENDIVIVLVEEDEA